MTMQTNNISADQQSVEATVSDVQVAIQQIALLEDNSSKQQQLQKINEIIAAVNQLLSSTVTPTQPVAVRNRGPVSEKQMTEVDAREIMLGGLSDKSHKFCAETLKLSYGQIYSARKGFTFKHIYKIATEAGKKW